MTANDILDPVSMRFFADFTEASLEAARVRPGELGRPEAPANTVGFPLIRPGGRDCYPAVWTQDFAVTLATGFVTAQEMKNHLHLIALGQNGGFERRLASGAVIPPYAIPDHVLFDGKPVYFPGTYSSGEDQGGEPWGLLPPANNHYDFILIAWHLWRATGDTAFLGEEVGGVSVIDRLRLAFGVPRIDPDSGLVYTEASSRAVGFIFCDSIYMTGHLLFASLLRWRSAHQLAELESALGNEDEARRWRDSVAGVPAAIASHFEGDADGWLLAATEVGRQADVWGTIYALYLGVLDGKRAAAAHAAILQALERGTICHEGGVRHVPSDRDASANSAWERTHTPHNQYQNGAYWHSPSGWLIAVLMESEPAWARRIFREMITHFQREDFRKGEDFNAPWECFGKDGMFRKAPLFIGSVAIPYGVLAPLARAHGS
ncbi:hypothetical protein H5P28_16730 [Ruficoccus amylovorans]|uniref:Uncharacterized protein n=1 Tax=Ruficoccus amylovorans TaxID=1804625 RepID=A0A842HHM6_9BACT|nr:hypothetical protein [Ruficoccus amylovorans]MBC2595912.1 hypothetical protein [Ruficoccus amylovorans]